ncbi:tRNA wybutosine-synthesizing protein 5-like [Amphiura filiformis]|uniref:tRNA wybutosine-synthesizing protein 5-like n=1 Tax=Amphiura filiformis TaxID=82378 RepID=UPI003B2186ED
MNSVLAIITVTCFVTIAKANTDVLQIPPNGLGAKGKQINITTLLEWPTTESFMTDYAKPARPFIVRNAAKDWKASLKWTDEYLMSIDEGMKEKVTVEQAKKEDRNNPAEELSLHEFVRGYQEKDWYMVERVPMFLRQDIVMPPLFQCPLIANLLLEQMMWFSNGGTKSVLHFDSMDNIHCLITGRKLFVLIDPKNKVEIDQPQGSYSSVDVDNVDYSKHPDLLNLEYHMAYLSAGDCMYLPYHWYHQVRAADRNIGVNIWWNHFSMMTMDYSSCEDVPQQHHKTMDQFQFQGTDKLLQHEEAIKSHFRMLTGQGGTPLTYDRLLFMFLGDEEHRPGMKDGEDSLKTLFQSF